VASQPDAPPVLPSTAVRLTITLVALGALASCKGEPTDGSRARQAVRATAASATPGVGANPPGTAPGAAPAVLARVAPESLCMTTGAIARQADGRVAVDEPKVRGVVAGSSGESAELRFVYRGPTVESEALASGQLRRQLGLKLRAADGCNLVYVMWRIEPTPGLEVSIKRNPGQRVNAECGTNGYVKIAQVAPIPTLAIGAAHTLRAEIAGGVLTATIDGAEVWRDALGTPAVGLAGPAGFRSDNVAYDLELDAVVTDPTQACAEIVGD
jgi:hypothetical protein